MFRRHVCSGSVADLGAFDLTGQSGEAEIGQDGAEALVKQVLDAFGKIDILVNNAGITRDDLIMRMKPEDWTDLAAEVRDAGDQRVVVSSEFLSFADEAAARRVVTELSGGPVHVVITLRPIYKIAPSQWQQYVQNWLRVPYGEWLDGMFRRPPYDQPTPSFWRRHKQDELVRRWAGVAGAENLTVLEISSGEIRNVRFYTECERGSRLSVEVPQQNAAARLGRKIR